MTTTTPPLAQRLYSLDALRGFDMFWIMGAEDIVDSLAKATKSPAVEAVANQLTHPQWHGFHFYDLIFPLFLFMTGVATPYSVGRALEKGTSKSDLVLRVMKRAFVLFLLGLIVNNGLHLRPFSEIRFGSVLGKIGLAYMFANIIYIYTSKTGWIVWFCCLLVGYWALFLLGAAPGFPPGDLTMEGNIVSYWDRSIMPGKLYLGIHDPEGVVAIIPAIGNALLGIFAGDILKNNGSSMPRKAFYLLAGGLILLLMGGLWNLVFPINKNLWTSSFVLYVGGWSFLLLSLFYFVIDVKGYKGWAFFFSIIGMNSILIYMSGRFIDWAYTTKALFMWLAQLAGDPYNLVVLSVCFVMVKWTFLYFMYKKNVFLRV